MNQETLTYELPFRHVCYQSIYKKTPKHVAEWFKLRDEDSLYISVVTIAEMTDGIERLRASKKKARLQEFLIEMTDRLNNRLLLINTLIATDWEFLNSTLLKQGITTGVQDLYIAATARTHGMSIITLNEKHFIPTGVKVINPWKFV